MDAGRLKVKSPYRHNDCAPVTGVTLSAAHISGMFCFTFNDHTLHKPPQEIREKLSAVKLPAFSWQKHIIKGSWLKNSGEERRGRGCTVNGEEGGAGTEPWSLQVKLSHQQIVSLQWSLLTAACTLPLSNETDAIETDEQNSVKGNLKRVDLVEACRQSLAVSWCTGWHTPSLPITSHKHNGTLWLISNIHNLNSLHFFKYNYYSY